MHIYIYIYIYIQFWDIYILYMFNMIAANNVNILKQISMYCFYAFHIFKLTLTIVEATHHLNGAMI